MDSLSVTDSIIPKNNFDIYVEKINNLTAFLRIFKHDLKSIEIDKKMMEIITGVTLILIMVII